MHQRHTIRIDNGRASSAKNGPVSSPPTQVAFHKIYRKKRCYSLVDKEQEGHTGSQWKTGFVNSGRDDDTGLRSNYLPGSSSLKPIRTIEHDNAASWSKYSSGSSSFKPIQRIDSFQRNNSSGYLVSPLNRESAKSYRQHLKRPNDRLGCNSVSGSEFDEPNKSSKYSVGPPNRESGKGYWQHSTRPNDRLGCNSVSGTEFDEPNESSRYSVSPPNREIGKGSWQHLKRPNDGLGFNSVSGSEFDEPFVKKQKVESYKHPALQHIVSPETVDDKQKMTLDDTKWMYKNQHAKMSGPYSARQLMEGFYTRFLLEDMPVYQFLDGKLCKPIMLKQLIDDLESCNSQMCNPGREFNSEESFHHLAPKGIPCNAVKDMDLPPGFGGRSAPLSESPSRMHVSNATASAVGPKCSVGAFSSSMTDVGIAEFDLPPGFKAVAGMTSLRESHITELSGSSRKLSTGGVEGRSEGAQRMNLRYEKFDPVDHGRGHSSHQGSSPHSKVSHTIQGANALRGNSMQLEPIAHPSHQGSLPHSKVSYIMQGAMSLSDDAMKVEPIANGRGHIGRQGSSPPSVVNFTLQGARSLNETSSWCTTWGFASPSTRASNTESQTFSSPTVCIGLPVSKPAVQNWPVVNNLPIAYAQANDEFVPPEYSEFSARHDLDPLVIIRLELLAAVKRSYVKTILSAVIDEQLKCWIEGKDTMVKSLLAEDSSRSREASLSSAEVGVMSVESNTFQTDASTALAKHYTGALKTPLHVRPTQSSDGSCLNACVGSADTSSEMWAAQCFDGSGLINRSACILECQNPSAEALNTRNDGDTYTSLVTVDTRSMSDTEQNSLGAGEVPVVRKRLELCHDLDKAESFLYKDEASKLSVKSSSLLSDSCGNSKQAYVCNREEVEHQSGDGILPGDGAMVEKIHSSGNTADALLLETEPSFLVSGRKNLNIKSLKHLLQITSKRRSKLGSSVYKKEKTSCRTAQATVEGRLQNGVSILKDYNGCARTCVDGWLWHKRFQPRDCRFFCIQLNAQTYHAQPLKLPAAAVGSSKLKRTQSEATLKLARSKIHEWGVFAVKPIESGAFVIEYVGEVVRPRISDIRERHYKMAGIKSSYLFRVDDEMVVDATKRGGLARFMNYSCEPNCCARIVTVEGSKKVRVYAKRHITVGEELTHDCKSQLGDHMISCNCGSIRCRGLMDTNNA